MSGMILLLLLLGAAFIAAAKLGLLKKGRGGRTEHWPVFPKKVLTPVEQQLYQRLIRAYPDHVVLAQVSFSQIIGVKKGHDFRAIWNRYNRLTADFVLCNKDFSIAAVHRARRSLPRSPEPPGRRPPQSRGLRCRRNPAAPPERQSTAERDPSCAVSFQPSVRAYARALSESEGRTAGRRGGRGTDSPRDPAAHSFLGGRSTRILPKPAATS